MQQQLDRYWDYLRIERQVSPHTLNNYQRQLRAVVEILQEKQLNTWQQVTPSVVRLILAESKRQDRKSVV